MYALLKRYIGAVILFAVATITSWAGGGGCPPGWQHPVIDGGKLYCVAEGKGPICPPGWVSSPLATGQFGCRSADGVLPTWGAYNLSPPRQIISNPQVPVLTQPPPGQVRRGPSPAPSPNNVTLPPAPTRLPPGSQSNSAPDSQRGASDAILSYLLLVVAAALAIIGGVFAVKFIFGNLDTLSTMIASRVKGAPTGDNPQPSDFTFDGNPRGMGWQPAGQSSDFSPGSAQAYKQPPVLRAGFVRGEVRGFQARSEPLISILGNLKRNIIVWTFRVERYSSSGDHLPPVPVEMRGDAFKGLVADGDEVEINTIGKEKGGTIYTNQVGNLSTRAAVQAIRKSNFSTIFKFILFLLLLLLVGTVAYIANHRY
jgi:hypothetical protein